MFHDKQDDWQFLTRGENQLDPVVEVPLQTILAIDSTLLMVADLEKGWKAWRAAKDSSWHRALIDTRGP